MIDQNTNLSNRFFYVNPTSDDESDDARIFPMSRLISMSLNSSTNFNLMFDDAGVGDHTLVVIVITADKGREAMKDVVDAINSHQKVVVLGDQFTGESIISDYVGGNVSINEGTVGTFALNSALTVAEAATFTAGSQNSAVARTATSDGTGTGTIAAGTSFVSVTSAAAANIIILPAPVVGNSIILHVGANGYELRTSDPTSISLNNTTGSGVELAVAANNTIRCICTTSTSWIAEKLSNAGAPAAGGTPDA